MTLQSLESEYWDFIDIIASCYHVRVMYNPLAPHFYSKTGVYRGVHHILSFALKHRLLVLVRTVLMCTHNQCFEQKLEKYYNFSSENYAFQNFNT